MTRQYISMENLRFLLFEVHEIEKLISYPRYAHIGGKEELDSLLDAAKGIADKEMFPFFKEMDSKPVIHKDGRIHSHPQLKNIFKAVAGAGWFTATTELDDGGMQLPHSIFSAAHLIFEAANSSAQGYIGVSTGSLELISNFGDETLKKTYMPPMMEGKWQGTMALTEPQAGSSLSDISTSAEINDENCYNINGQKIFISAGEHEACENFIHLTLARIKGAPAGTKGISLFVVPKYLPAEDGSLQNNNLICAADFQKMGQRGYATTHLIFGEGGTTKGFLLGEANKGLSYMFQMMNAARIAVGQTAAAVASAAYYNALNYANERPQGRHIADKDLSKEQTLIINHADVRRMLMMQKSIVEGSLGLIVECLKWYDLEKVLEGAEKENAFLLLEILTPIVKTYPSEAGIVAVSNALQVFGGYGFTMDFDAQQYYREIRIMSIYEGTTGIQSLDLLGRKITMHSGKAWQLLTAEINKTILNAGGFENLQIYSIACQDALVKLQKVLQYLKSFAIKGEVELYMADANLFMEYCGLLTVAWQWLKQAIIAQQTLNKNEITDKQRDFYISKLETMKFYFKYELPKTEALTISIMHTDKVTLKKEREILI
jgi:alkylation response protein AidB-like acyl-CoA dehydrogenase